jgi:hypothetical protein
MEFFFFQAWIFITFLKETVIHFKLMVLALSIMKLYDLGLSMKIFLTQLKEI